jgi:hypothetical protein
MIVTERKSKYKHKVIVPRGWVYQSDQIENWCTVNFGFGGRSKHLRWRRGWFNDNDVYYFRHGADATLFTLKWA